MLSVIAVTAILASCGGGSGSENTDTTTKVSADTSMAAPGDTTHVAPDTTHKDTAVH